MKVKDIMTRDPRVCHANDNLKGPARIMWEADCGFVPVIDDQDRLVGVITDRDICMAAYTQGAPLEQIHVERAMAKQVFACSIGDSINSAERLMQEKRIRRLPVVDEGGRLMGVVSMGDLARENASEGGLKAREVTAEGIVSTLSAVSQPNRAEQRA